jgi:hypothetical protein
MARQPCGGVQVSNPSVWVPGMISVVALGVYIFLLGMRARK